MSLRELLHHVQLCKFFWSSGGECEKGDCCAFAHQLHQLREPTQEFLQSHKTRKFHMWSEGDILPDRHHVCETIAWAIWDLQQGLAPPEWVYKLHFHATLKYGDEYLNDVSRILVMCLMMLGALNLHPQSLRTRGSALLLKHLFLRRRIFVIILNMSMDNILKSPTMINALKSEEASRRNPITLHAHHQLI